jgi:hypothetical protein
MSPWQVGPMVTWARRDFGVELSRSSAGWLMPNREITRNSQATRKSAWGAWPFPNVCQLQGPSCDWHGSEKLAGPTVQAMLPFPVRGKTPR